MIDFPWQVEDDHVTDIGVRNMFPADSHRNPFVVRKVDSEEAPVEGLSTLGRAKVFPNHQTRLSLRHRDSFGYLQQHSLERRRQF